MTLENFANNPSHKGKHICNSHGQHTDQKLQKSLPFSNPSKIKKQKISLSKKNKTCDRTAHDRQAL